MENYAQQLEELKQSITRQNATFIINRVSPRTTVAVIIHEHEGDKKYESVGIAQTLMPDKYDEVAGAYIALTRAYATAFPTSN